MARYLDKVVIVTGGSKGIGEGCVRVFVQNGAKVVLCARGEADALKLVEELNAKGNCCIFPPAFGCCAPQRLVKIVIFSVFYAKKL